MPTEEQEAAPVKLSELVDAFEFVSVSDLDEHQAYICKRTGRIIFVSESEDLEEDIELPDDPELGRLSTGTPSTRPRSWQAASPIVYC